VTLLELLSSQIETGPESADMAGSRTDELLRALQSGTSPEVVERFLSPPRRTDIVVRYLEVMRLRCIPPLLQHLAVEEDISHRKALVEVLTFLGAQEISLIVGSIDDERWYFVRNLATILGRVQTPACEPHLARLAKHPDPRVRKEAIRSLSLFANDNSTDILCQTLHDPDHSVRLAAIGGLAASTSTAGSRCLVGFVKEKSRRPLMEKKQALNSLWLQGSAEGRGLLRQLVSRRIAFTRADIALKQHAQDLLDRTRAPRT
ncbi:MAG: HEAT repeat domain-containing protein, partial [Actinobacteria bacterium]|nr:HEAT repeat domain-containing protein [Actinomycetota bacterium]